MGYVAQSVFALGKLQTNYTTEVAIANDGFRQLAKEGYEKPVFSSPNVTNAGYATGSPYATRVSKDRDDVTFSGTERATFQALGFHAVDSFGVYATPTEVVEDVVWTHSFTLLNPFVSDILPTRPLASKIGEPALSANIIYDARFPSMMKERTSFSSEGATPDLQISADWRGSGKIVEPSAVQFFGSGKDVILDEEMDEQFVRKTSGVLTLYTAASLGGSSVLPGCDFRDITMTINNNLNADAGYNGCALFQDGDANKGAIRGSMRSGGQTVEWSATMIVTADLVDDFDLTERLKAGTPFSASIKYTGGEINGDHDHEATFTLNKAVLSSVEWIDLDNGTQGIRIVAEPMAVSSVMPFSLLLKTDVADFNTFVAKT